MEFLLHQDNQLEIRIPVSVTSDWRVTGASKPSHVEYNITQPKVDKYIVEDQIGERSSSHDMGRDLRLGAFNV